ncbi:MAG: hypothetical protein S4CHLAM45_05950 [Chlamydiales bacterium]|nr:hypothetical protein [Chlamydiales bacterium]MCH9619864.1 hypothetical protein [Chlamydiales bacterium]MCH9622709.1 hypothetical protein [Chlamydiales bacterium]
MSRRDTIIIAVLVNAGLLMVLFATALKSDDKKKGEATSFTQLAQAPVEKVKEEERFSPYVAAPTSAVPTLETITEEIAFEELNIPEVQPVAVEPKTSEINYVSVTVKKGDFLERIAKANNTTVSSIMTENKMTSTQLKVGQVLRVPVRQSPLRASTPAAAEEYYVVRDGDNPWTIASKNQISVSELLRRNNLDEQKARRLRPGDRLKIR